MQQRTPDRSALSQRCDHVTAISLRTRNTHSVHCQCSRCAYNARHNSRCGIHGTHKHSHRCAQTSLAVHKKKLAGVAQHAVHHTQLNITFAMRWKHNWP